MTGGRAGAAASYSIHSEMNELSATSLPGVPPGSVNSLRIRAGEWSGCLVFAADFVYNPRIKMASSTGPRPAPGPCALLTLNKRFVSVCPVDPVPSPARE